MKTVRKGQGGIHMAGNDRKEFLTDLPENYDAYQEARQNGTNNGFQDGFQDSFQNEELNDFTFGSQYYFDNTGLSQEQWQAASYPVNTKPLRQGLAIASMVLGILSIILCCIFGGVLALPGLILGIISLVSKRDGSGMAIAGIITSIFGLLLGVFMVIIFISSLKEIAENSKNGKTSYNYSYSFGNDGSDGFDFNGFDFDDDFNFDKDYDNDYAREL